MNPFVKKLAEACVEVLVREMSEKVVKTLIDQGKAYVSRTIEKGRQTHNARREQR